MTVRLAVPADAPQIAAIWTAMIRDTLWTFTSEPKSPPELAKLIAARPNSFWVIADDAGDAGQIDGFATFDAFRGGPGYAQTVEHTVVLRPDALGRGLGQQLMQAAQKAAKDAGYHVMIGALSGVNTRAIAFHKKLGFQQVALMPQVGRKGGQ